MISNDHKLSLVVPSYKQAQTIVRNIRQLTTTLGTIRYDFEVIVVIDGEFDDTLQRLKRAKIPNVRVLSYKQNQGKAYALRLGMMSATGDYIMFIDAGMEIDPNGISMLIEHMEWYEADIIVGSKRHPASRVNYTTQRKILSYGYYFFVWLVFGIKIKDTQAGIKVFRKDVLLQVIPRLVENRFAGDLEMLVVSRYLGFNRIFEAPIKLNYEFSALTSAATWKSILAIFADTLAVYYRMYFLDSYQKPRKNLDFPENLEEFNFRD